MSCETTVCDGEDIAREKRERKGCQGWSGRLTVFPLECSLLLIEHSDPFRTEIASRLYGQLQPGLVLKSHDAGKNSLFSPPQQARFNLAGLCLYSDGWHEDDASSQCRSWQIVFFEIVLLSCENICNLSFHHGWETRARMTPLCSVCRWTTFPPSPYVIVHVILSDGGDKCSVSSMFLHAFRICFFNLLRGSSRARAAEHGWLCELWDASLEERLKAVEHSYSKNSSLCRAVQQRSAPDAYRI